MEYIRIELYKSKYTGMANQLFMIRNLHTQVLLGEICSILEIYTTDKIRNRFSEEQVQKVFTLLVESLQAASQEFNTQIQVSPEIAESSFIHLQNTWKLYYYLKDNINQEEYRFLIINQ